MRSFVPNSGALFLKFLLTAVVVVVSSSCITPPKLDGPSIIPEAEFQVVSALTAGQQFSQSGRVDLAEIQYRRALTLGADLANVYNNLGFVLQSQGRYDEALIWYRRAVKSAPRHVIARENIARVLYELGEYRLALYENIMLLDIINGSEPESLREIVGEPVGKREVVDIYRNISQIYLTVGVLDDAVCYSWLAFITAQDMFEAGRHSRLLLSLDLIPPAIEILRGAVIVHEGNVPAKILVDYGISLFLGGSHKLADAAVARVLTMERAARVDRRTARLVRILAAKHMGEVGSLELLSESLFDDEPEFCELPELDQDHYWPLKFRDQVDEFVRSVCLDGSKRAA